MPFKTRRSSTRGTPRGLLGSSGSITRHSKSGQIISAHAEPESEIAMVVKGKPTASCRKSFHYYLPGMDTLFWRLAHRRYASRSPSVRFEIFTLGFGAFFAAIYALAVFINPTPPNALRLAVALIVVGAGLAHRRVRLERNKGPDALYQKTLTVTD